MRNADSTVDLHAARLMTYHAAWSADQGRDFHLQAAAVKPHAHEVYMRIVDSTIEIHGGRLCRNKPSVENPALPRFNTNWLTPPFAG